MIHFAEAVITVAESFQILPLTTYGDTLLRCIKVFNIPKVENLLTLFLEIVEVSTTSVQKFVPP